MRVSLQAGYILHSRPYRNTSLLLDVFSREQGRGVLVARGARRARSPLQGLLQPFAPLLLSWQGAGEVQTLTAAESAAPAIALQGGRLLSGFYLNELLLRLLGRHDPHPDLYDAYGHTLQALAAGGHDAREQASLRIFESFLLRELGYGLQLEQDSHSGEPLRADACYCYEPERGPRRLGAGQDCEHGLAVQGRTLLALRRGELDLNDAQLLREAKRLMRMSLAPHLGERPLKSRELYLQQRQLLESTHD